MNRLKNLLQSNIFYLIIIFITTIFVIVKTILIEYESVLDSSSNSFIGEVVDYSLDSDKLVLTLNNSENIIVYYNLKDNDEFVNLYGATVEVEGEYYLPSNNTVPNCFNYKEYLYQNGIFYLFDASEVTVVNTSYNIKNLIINRINKIEGNDYLMMFLLGDKTLLSDEVYELYQSNGIAHLLAISGLHISMFILILEFILRKVKRNKRQFIIFNFLLFYLYLTNFSVSLLRCFIFYILSIIVRNFDVKISNIKMLIITAAIVLFINPFYIYSTAFLYSFIITLFLVLMDFKSNKYITNLFFISFISFLASLPITININYELNITSIFLNLLFVPYVSFILFPLSLLTFVFPILDFLLVWFIEIFEYLNYFTYKHFGLMIIIAKVRWYFIIVYYILLFLFVKLKQKYLFFSLFILLQLNNMSYKLDNKYHVYFMDIGQGDCQILISPYLKEVIMIDTGGNYYYSVSENVILFLKSLGISKLDVLIVSHGDYDHIGEFNNINEELIIDSVMINYNEVNEYEQEIIDSDILVVNAVDLEYFNSINYNYDISNENDASLVMPFTLYNSTILFTGDIGTDALENLLSKYNLSSEFYKVSHHGSKNNTSEEIIAKVNPSYAFISAGENNIYNHPSTETLDILESMDVLYYTTIEFGTIELVISETDFNIITYSP